jgi:hypothetical protein
MKKNVRISLPKDSYDHYVDQSAKVDTIASVAAVATAALKLITVVIDHKKK